MQFVKKSNSRVTKLNFCENQEHKENVKLNVQVGGNGSIPKELKVGDQVFLRIGVKLGDEATVIQLDIEMFFEFQVISYDSKLNNEEELTSNCSEIAIVEMRETIKKVTADFGIPEIDLPLDAFKR